MFNLYENVLGRELINFLDADGLISRDLGQVMIRTHLLFKRVDDENDRQVVIHLAPMEYAPEPDKPTAPDHP